MFVTMQRGGAGRDGAGQDGAGRGGGIVVEKKGKEGKKERKGGRDGSGCGGRRNGKRKIVLEKNGNWCVCLRLKANTSRFVFHISLRCVCFDVFILVNVAI